MIVKVAKRVELLADHIKLPRTAASSDTAMLVVNVPAMERPALLAPEVELPVPLSCIARAWNAAKLLGPLSTALTENTMPWPQWVACLQYTQIGAD